MIGINTEQVHVTAVTVTRTCLHVHELQNAPECYCSADNSMYKKRELTSGFFALRLVGLVEQVGRWGWELVLTVRR